MRRGTETRQVQRRSQYLARRNRVLALASLAIASLLPGCASFVAPNPPLSTWDPNHGYRRTLMQDERPLGPIVMVLALSGGGTRAAAFSYGVLQELRDSEVVVRGKRVRLLDEVDLISSVSGGSFTSAYYGLFGDRIFDDFETRFLRRNVQSELVLSLLNPVNWFTLLFTPANRTDLAIRHYDREIFDGATFADLDAAGGPYLQINSTDLAMGARFTFIQPQFDFICSDLQSVRVARAVAASSAVPVLFDSVTLKNYAGSCGYELPEHLKAALDDPRRSRRHHHLATTTASYLDISRRPYIHLVDGGVVDNQGLLAPLETVELMGGAAQRFRAIGAESPEHVVVIAVDAEVNSIPSFSQSPNPPSLAEVVGAMTTGQLNRMTFETTERMHKTLNAWADEFPVVDGGRRPTVHMIDVAFDFLQDPGDRAYFNGLPTSFKLEDAQVDRLIAAGRQLLRQSPEYQELMRALHGTLSQPPGEAQATRDP